MLRVLAFFLLVFVLGIGFAALANRPGDLVVTFQGYEYQVTLMVAAVAVTAIVAAAMLAWWLLKSLWNSPYTIARHFRVRRRDRGYQSLSTGIIAAGAGDAHRAREMNRQAAKLISADQEPLLHLLEVQTLLLEGDHAAARGRFEAMLADPELKPLALRGLYLEAQRLGDRQALRHYAAEAAEVAPQLGWAASAAIEEKAENGDWDGALKLFDAQRATGRIDKAAANRRRAVLLTAKAMQLVDADPTAAKMAALEATRLEPALVPAGIAAARALFRLGDVKRGARVLEALWKKEPHPEVADAYVHARPGDSAHDRLARAQKLRALRPNHACSSLAVARAALDAGEFELARREADAAIRQQPREGAYLLRADIEEAETGDQGRVRALLARAVRAGPDPAWIADGVIAERWAPLSPVTGRLDAFEWRLPAEKLGPVVEEAPLPPVAIVAPPPLPSPGTAAEGEPSRPAADKPAPRPADPGPALREVLLPGPPDDPGVEEPGSRSGVDHADVDGSGGSEATPAAPAGARFRLF